MKLKKRQNYFLNKFLDTRWNKFDTQLEIFRIKSSLNQIYFLIFSKCSIKSIFKYSRKYIQLNVILFWKLILPSVLKASSSGTSLRQHPNYAKTSSLFTHSHHSFLASLRWVDWILYYTISYIDFVFKVLFCFRKYLYKEVLQKC